MFQTSYRSGSTETSFYYVFGDENSMVQSGVMSGQEIPGLELFVFEKHEKVQTLETHNCLRQNEDII